MSDESFILVNLNYLFLNDFLKDSIVVCLVLLVLQFFLSQQLHRKFLLTVYV